MPISALVITLADEPSARERACRSLAGEAALSLGPRSGSRLAAVAETESLLAGAELLERVLLIDGVDFVDLVSVDFSDLES
ncbi:hypothetical protein AB3662_25095 [Sorangium cellulosum]|uniref:hypothetical protein n=1 Tax=Sorangium cellulosum TaxID=56 RepID=UPI003D9AAB1E